MSEIIERIYTPFILGVRVGSVPDTINNRVSKSCIGMFVVDLSSQTILILFVEAKSHFFEEF